jgi:methyl-accepting chemotaxis protein
MVRVWRNLKISRKLSYGFGLILLVFVASVYTTWNYIKTVENSSNFLAKEVMRSLELATSFKLVADGVLKDMQTVHYTEKQEIIASYKDHLLKADKVRGELLELNKQNPGLESSAHVLNKVFPVLAQYSEQANKIFSTIEKKQALMKTFATTGAQTSTATEELFTSIVNLLKNSVQSSNFRLNPTIGTNSLVDATELSARLFEKTMYIRREVWQAISKAQSGGGTDGIQTAVSRVKDLLDQAEKLESLLVNTEKEREMVRKLLSLFKNYETNVSEFMKVLVDLDQQHSALTPLMESLDTEIQAAQKKASDYTKEISNSNVGALSFAISVMLWCTIACVVLGIIVIILITRSISRPLNTIASLVGRAGDGDLTIKKADFGYDGRDEMGGMVSALVSMVESQSNTMTHITSIAKDLAEGASDLSAISEETNAIMEEIKASVSQVSTLSESNGSALEECNAGVEEMSAGADTVAKSATDSASFISQTTSASNNAIQKVRSVIGGMRNVDTNAQKSEDKIRQLVSSVENVSSFVSVITGIADQTNLLALNAAIEAARAGEVGRGFAVVAEEVRKLAEESARAANNVNGIIQELQTGAQESITATTEAGSLLKSTLEQAEHALEELNGAMNQMNKANDSIQNIAAVAEEQAASSREVALAIDSVTKSSIEMVGAVSGINHATNEAAQATEGVAKQAEAMTEHSKSMTELLSMFKLETSQSKNIKSSRNR